MVPLRHIRSVGRWTLSPTSEDVLPNSSLATVRRHLRAPTSRYSVFPVGGLRFAPSYTPNLRQRQSVRKRQTREHAVSRFLECCRRKRYMRPAGCQLTPLHRLATNGKLVTHTSTLLLSKRRFRVFLDLRHCSTVIRTPKLAFCWRPTRRQRLRSSTG